MRRNEVWRGNAEEDKAALGNERREVRKARQAINSRQGFVSASRR